MQTAIALRTQRLLRPLIQLFSIWGFELNFFVAGSPPREDNRSFLQFSKHLLLSDRAWIVHAIHVSKNLQSALDLVLRAGEVPLFLQTEFVSVRRSWQESFCWILA